MIKVLNWGRVWTVTVRHIQHVMSDFSRFTALFYWPFVDVLLWGYSGMYLQNMQGNEASSVASSLLIGAVLWQILVRANFDVSISLIEELWSHNITNLFSTPLTLSEWIVAIVILAFLMVTAIAAFLAGVVWFFYKISVFTLGLTLLPAILALTFAGMAIGFFAAICIITWGARMDSIVFMLGWAFAPFSGVYYTIDVLPYWAQIVSKCMPMLYAFDAMRVTINTGTVPMHALWISLGLSVVYFIGALILFVVAFEKSREKGLARLVH